MAVPYCITTHFCGSLGALRASKVRTCCEPDNQILRMDKDVCRAVGCVRTGRMERDIAEESLSVFCPVANFGSRRAGFSASVISGSQY